MKPLPREDFYLDNDIHAFPPGERDAALKVKAGALHDAACSIQDLLENVGVFIGDDGLIEAKVAIQRACDKARRACEEVMYR